MTISVALTHETRYDYDRPVNLAPQTIRLRPAPHCRTPITDYSLGIIPKRHHLNWIQDPYSNHLARVVFPEPTREFVITVELKADLIPINPFDFYIEPTASTWPFDYDPDLREELVPCLATAEPGPKLAAWIEAVPRERIGTVELLVGLSQRSARDIAYETRMSPGLRSIEETLALGSGSCRDSAWLLVQILRRLGIAARFASGYLIQLEPDVAELHAWAEAYVPGAGWIGLDPTSGLLAGEGHLPLACSPKPERAAPVSGLVGECEVRFGHSITVARTDGAESRSGRSANE